MQGRTSDKPQGQAAGYDMASSDMLQCMACQHRVPCDSQEIHPADASSANVGLHECQAFTDEAQVPEALSCTYDHMAYDQARRAAQQDKGHGMSLLVQV